MDQAERDYIGALLRDAARRDRGYASFFDWPDKTQKEVGVVLGLLQSLLHTEQKTYSGLRARGEGNDPPDCEAVDPSGRPIGIEVTELVDGLAIHEYKRGNTYVTAEWTSEKFRDQIGARVRAKDRPKHLKGGPYSAYWLVIHCDEPELSIERVEGFLRGMRCETALITEAFLLMSYVPQRSCYPYFRIPLAAAA